MTAQALADRCAELGHPLDRSVIAKLEKGHRHTVTVADVLIIATALGVSPLELIYPIGEDDTTEALPGKPRPTWATVRWLTGWAAFPTPDTRATGNPLVGDDDDNRRWMADRTLPLPMHLEHDGLLLEVERQTYRVSVIRARIDPQDPHLGDEVERLDLSERRLARHREEMRRQGYVPPPLPDALRHLDEPMSWMTVMGETQARALVAGNLSLDQIDREGRARD